MLSVVMMTVIMLSVSSFFVMLGAIMLSVASFYCYAGCHSAESLYIECLGIAAITIYHV
jgi:hypothetical protein